MTLGRSILNRRCCYLVHKQATELCGEKAANLQTTLIHLQWQRKHVEQRLMAKRAAGDLGTEATTADAGIPFDGSSEETAPLVAGTTQHDGCSIARNSSRSRAGSTTTSTSPRVALASPGDNKRPNSRLAAAESEGLEVLQLVAKGQALSSAVMVVESVLHKMEEQARYLAFLRLALGVKMVPSGVTHRVEFSFQTMLSPTTEKETV